MDDMKTYTIAQQYYKEFGQIVRIDLPGQSPDVWLYNPHDMLKLFRAEGPYPDGPVRLTWPVDKYNSRQAEKSPLISIGEEWKQHRNKLNPGIFNVQAAQEFTPNLNHTAADLSAHFPKHAGDLATFCRLASFDLFCSGVIGKSLRVISEDADPRDVAFADAAAEWFELMGDLLFSPFETLVKDSFDTKTYKKFENTQNAQYVRAKEIVEECRADPSIERSYLKVLSEGGLFTEDEAAREVLGLLGAAVDTTATTLLWLLYDLARNPEAQALAAAEVRAELSPTGAWRPDAKLPYLKACYRESLRHSPIGNTGTFRTTPADMELGGYHIPKGTRVNTVSAAMMMDPDIVEEPHRFKPERWLPAAVEARKGTDREIHDHRLLGANFGFGPRMCLGARFAKNEIFALTARILYDWEMAVKVPHEKVVMRLLLAPKPSPQLELSQRS